MFVDGDDDEIIIEKIGFGGPSLDSCVVYSLHPLFRVSKSFIEEGVLKVDALGPFRMFLFKSVLQPSKVEDDKIVVQELSVVEFLNIPLVYSCPVLALGRIND
jgi:hypothetical protein